ncbi:hypothetical protein JCM24511_05464 [Saitozyma sp. JCM 24511]|nr:hypothetical protein JCM24511_05464 [Saitozyma sp. JCM 24511]
MRGVIQDPGPSAPYQPQPPPSGPLTFDPNDPFDPTQFILALSSQVPTVEATDASPVYAHGPQSLRAMPSSGSGRAGDRLELDAAPRTVRITWWRPHGPTAIVPGLKRVTIKVRVGPNVDAPSQEPLRLAGQGGTPKGRTEDLFDDRGLPRSDILVHLIDLFAQHFECQYPALDRHSLLRSAQEGSGSVFLLSCVAGMAARFSTHTAIAKPDLRPHEYGNAFANRAKTHLASSLAVPSRETVSALTLLAVLGLSNDSESEMWMYTGMAVRMALDLGLHLDASEAQGITPDERRLNILTFWPIVLLDFSLSFGTGRRTTLSVDDITQVIPTQDDMRPALAFHEASDQQQQPTSHGRSPFPYAARQMLAYGQLINLLNGPAEDTPERTEALRKARSLVIDVYNQLPPDMLWSATNLQIHRQAHQSPIFLHLHLWMHAMISYDFVSRPQPNTRRRLSGPISAPPSGSATPTHTASDVWRNSVRTIGDILVLSDVIDPFAYLALPYVNQAFYVAGCCYMKELEQYATASTVADHVTTEPTASMSLQRQDAATRPTAEDASKKQADLFRSLLTSAARSSISTLQQGLARMTTYWSGISWIAGALDQRAAGIPTNDIDLVAVQEQLAPYISQPETVFAASPATPATQQRLAGQTPRVETVQQGLTDGSFDFADFDFFSLPFDLVGLDTATDGQSTGGFQMA